MTLSNSITTIAEEVTAARRALHENPQTSYEETFASNLIAQKLTEWGITFERNWAETGIVATIHGNKTDSGKAIALRADMDALDIIETSGQPWSSKTPGKMHGCGHDGHTAMLLGAAKYLADTRNFNGTVHLIFQPAEEGGAGAVKMIEQGLFEKFPVDAVFGLHNWPMMPKGTIGLKPGPIMASTDDFKIVVSGRGGHAALPHGTIDPVPAAAQLITALQTIVSRVVDPVDQAVVSVTNINGGTGATNVIPDSVTLTGTFRTFRNETRALVRRRVLDMAQTIPRAFQCEATCTFKDGYDPTINSPLESAFCADVARALLGAENVNDSVEPCMGAEDFGAMTQKVPGCYIWLGQGEPDKKDSPHNKGLHNAGYDFNDSIIPLGIEYWARITEKYLPLGK